MRMNSLIVILIIATSLLASSSVIADEGDDDHMDDHDMMGSWGMTYGALWMLVLIVALVVITVGLYKVLFNEGEGPKYKAPNTAEILLDERYARGDIETEEYLRMRHMIGR
ncbi:MAG: hypothetical protein KAJ35_05210 [Thermoplasmata archaeon]|nr:hypothetical protein [Thermoplasmata archaeon]